MSQSGKIVSTALSNEHTADIKMIEHLVEGLKQNSMLFMDISVKN